jgi:hypothetical protein
LYALIGEVLVVLSTWRAETGAVVPIPTLVLNNPVTPEIYGPVEMIEVVVVLPLVVTSCSV